MKSPPIKGGQGRTPQDLEEAALTMMWFGGIALLIIIFLLSSTFWS